MKWKTKKLLLSNVITGSILVIYYLFFHSKSYLKQTGWFKSFYRQRSIEYNKKPIPWITYSCLKFIENKIKNDWAIAEFGSGSSTSWWAEKVKQVVAIEHNKKWYTYVKNMVPSNCLLIFAAEDEDKYEQALLKYQKHFDVIVIDGIKRVECAKNILSSLNNNGIIIWDNSDRKTDEEGIKYLMKHKYRKIDFWGMGPIGFDAWQTSIFYKQNNCLDI